MANPYTNVPVSSAYNASPPSDDASQVASNQLFWSKHLSKIGNPLKAAIEAINTNTANAFGKRLGTTFELKAANYSIAAPGDQGKVFSVTGTTTITLPAVADAGDGFPVAIINNGTATVSVDGNASELIDGSASFTLAANDWALLTTDGSTWTASIVRASLVVTKYKTVTTPRNTTTVLADDPHLLGWVIEPATHYAFEGFLGVFQNVGDFKYAFQFSNAPQSAQLFVVAIDQAGTPNVLDNFKVSMTTAQGITTMTDGQQYGLKINGMFLSHASLSAVLDFQWAQNTSDANNTNIVLPSWISVRKLG